MSFAYVYVHLNAIDAGESLLSTVCTRARFAGRYSVLSPCKIDDTVESCAASAASRKPSHFEYYTKCSNFARDARLESFRSFCALGAVSVAHTTPQRKMLTFSCRAKLPWATKSHP